MPFSDFPAVIIWWAYLFTLGLFFLPLTLYLFPRLLDGGYIFSKTIGMLILSYAVFFLSSVNLISFDRHYILGILMFSGAIIWFYFLKRSGLKRIKSDRSLIRLIILEEGIFLTLFTLSAFVRSFQPDIYGIEKFMNFGFINSILRTDNFPPQDHWFSGEFINYYYFGHLFSAVLIKLTNIPSNISFNLMLAFIFSIIFTSAFSLFIFLFSFFSKPFVQLTQRLKVKFLLSGIISAFLITLSGNLQVIYSFFEEGADKMMPFWKLELSISTFPNFYWYPTATRFIQNAIHEFPGYALILSDLHAHLLNTPVTILVITFLFSLFVKLRQQENKNSLKTSDMLFLCFLLSALFMGNSWDLIIFFGLAAAVILAVLMYKHRSQKTIIWEFFKTSFFITPVTFLFSLPFLRQFKPFVEGVGVNCSPDFLTDIGKIGPLLFEKDYCQITPLWQLMLIYGFFIFFAVSFMIFLRNLKKKKDSDVFISILFFIGLVLIFIPEVIYLKDIYPTHFRANTMFKLSYSSFVILSVASGYSLFRIIDSVNLKTRKIKLAIINFSFIAFSIFLIFLTSLYPIIAASSYYNNFTSVKGLDGTKYLDIKYPDDYKAIIWINENIKDQGVMLEAAGDSYTDYGRISAYTGLPTVINWTAHQWLWRSSYEKAVSRLTDVKLIYESADTGLTNKLLKKYGISYVYLGELENRKYNLTYSKFDILGKVIYSNDKSKIFKISL